MGKIISFWSYKNGYGTSSVLSIVAKSLSEKSNIKTLCIDLQHDKSTLRSYLGCKAREDMNIDGLLAILETGSTSNTIVNHYIQNTELENTSLMITNKTSSYNYLDELIKRKVSILTDLLLVLKESYDFILIDLPSGIGGLTFDYFFNQSDYIMPILTQERIHLLNMYNEMNSLKLLNDKVMGVLNFYDDTLSLTESFVKRELNINKLISIPYISNIKESLNEGNICVVDKEGYNDKLMIHLNCIFGECNIDDPSVNAEKEKKKFSFKDLVNRKK